jgi:hypothetical protein
MLTLDGALLQTLAARKPIAVHMSQAASEVAPEEQLIWVKNLVRCIHAAEWYVIESAKSGMASYVEVLIGPPSNAIAFRKCVYGPFAAIGAGSYTLFRPGELRAWTPLSLETVDAYDSSLSAVAQAISVQLHDDGVRLLSRQELSASVADSIAAQIHSSLPALEGRHGGLVYDVLFQWDD